MRNFISFVLLGACLASPAARAAETWPVKPVRLIAAAAPGGTTDQLARIIGQHLSEKFGKPFVVENKGGAGGGLAAQFVQQAEPDGYTLLVTNDQLSMKASFETKVEYDAIGGFKPVSTIVRGPVVMGVGKDVPVNDLQGLVKLAKAKDSRLAFGSCGSGTILHLAGELLNLTAGTQITHVPYRGCAPAMVDVLAGQIPMFVTVLGNAAPYAKEGKVKMLAVTSRNRLTQFPEVPTAREAGLGELVAEPWFGVLAPAKTPDAIVNRLAEELKAFVEDPAVAARLEEMYLAPEANGPERFATIIKADIDKWSRVVREAKVTVQ
ncbi:MAG: tripartite tricarboxylate transporter substrate-binding protein [Pigmentiphaga sp.]|uniref:Bug family tripartite tricarboxylate transporter substrate binding protein n=1 Tax=Pigmentiphaga sp. TaxID=1977564 RepID=UPI0029AE7917|nr:tripartite tricarboxylate transporter substrate-binding protein [Pigmentiphaga sp.]MDX3907280.1 tripartite tricarboxylate transporter substrate-binding protein [Pigmentiphaga sp.]